MRRVSSPLVFDEPLVTHILKSSNKLESPADLDPLMNLIGDAKYVLLGEASHGTHEYYTWRMHITKRLLQEKNFSFIAVEGDWPDCYKLNRYVKGYINSGESAHEVIHNFNRWPTWMWANWEVIAFAEWLHKYNKKLPFNKRKGFYGLDVYSLWESMDAIKTYLEKNDPKTLEAAERVVECFEPYGRDEGSSYGQATASFPVSCEYEVVELLTQIRKKLPLYNTDSENVFSTEQNAFIAVNAEHYYREMVHGGPESWNIRDRHMNDTLNRLMGFYGSNAKVIVWEHNTHIGDARATDMSKGGMVNIGELVKEEHDKDGVVRVGFGSYKGSVIAGQYWGAQMKLLKVPPAKEGTWEYLLHHAGQKNKLILSDDLRKNPFFNNHIGHRAIGVVYNPGYEYGNYVPSVIPFRYEAFIYLDETKALHPLHVKPNGHEMPETYPWGV